MLLLTACQAVPYSGVGGSSALTSPSALPSPRNACESAFYAQLIEGFDVENGRDQVVQLPSQQALTPVLSACTYEDLAAANDRFILEVGKPGQKILSPRILVPEGATLRDVLRPACDVPTMAATLTCQSMPKG